MHKYITLLMFNGCLSITAPQQSQLYSGTMTQYLQDVPKYHCRLALVFSGIVGTLITESAPIPELVFQDSLRGVIAISSGIVVGYVFPCQLSLDSALTAGRIRSVRYRAVNDSIGGIIGDMNGLSYRFTATRKE